MTPNEERGIQWIKIVMGFWFGSLGIVLLFDVIHRLGEIIKLLNGLK